MCVRDSFAISNVMSFRYLFCIVVATALIVRRVTDVYVQTSRTAFMPPGPIDAGCCTFFAVCGRLCGDLNRSSWLGCGRYPRTPSATRPDSRPCR
jgi:hypothetical protein